MAARDRGEDSSWEDINADEIEDDESDNEQNDEGDDDDDVSMWTELMSGWKQHCAAILVAIVATTVAYSSTHSGSLTTQLAPTTAALVLEKKHAHLHGYQRTANISFCGRLHGVDAAAAVNVDSMSNHASDMRVMDFHVPKKLIPTLILHYKADDLQDDDYSTVITTIMDTKDPATLLRHHEEYDCLRQQQESSPKNYIKGVTMYYKSPDIASMYPHDTERALERSVKKKAVSIQPAHLTFTGFAAKFINLSPQTVLLHWDERGRRPRLAGEIAPFESLGTATTPGQSFSVSPVYDSEHALQRWAATADEAVMTYTPTDVNLTRLSSKDMAKFQMQLLNAEFAKHYLIHSGRTWLAHFPRLFRYIQCGKLPILIKNAR